MMQNDFEDERPRLHGRSRSSRRRIESLEQTPGARESLDQVVERFRREVLYEADRIAASRQIDEYQEPITSSDVVNAYRWTTSRSSRATVGTIPTIAQTVSYIAAIVAGYFVNNVSLPWGSIGLVVTVLVGVGSFLTYLLYGREENFRAASAYRGFRDNNTEFLGKFRQLQELAARIASASLPAESRKPVGYPIGTSMKILEEEGTITGKDAARFRQVLAIRNALVHDQERPTSKALHQAQEDIDLLIGTLRAAGATND